MYVSCSYCNRVLLEFDKVFSTCCGHIFHKACLFNSRFNLLNESTCPICTSKCTAYDTERLYMSFTDESPEEIAFRALKTRMNKRKMQIQKTINRTKNFERKNELKILMQQTEEVQKKVDECKTKRNIQAATYTYGLEKKGSPSLIAKIILNRDNMQELQDDGDSLAVRSYNMSDNIRKSITAMDLKLKKRRD